MCQIKKHFVILKHTQVISHDEYNIWFNSIFSKLSCPWIARLCSTSWQLPNRAPSVATPVLSKESPVPMQTLSISSEASQDDTKPEQVMCVHHASNQLTELKQSVIGCLYVTVTAYVLTSPFHASNLS